MNNPPSRPRLGLLGLSQERPHNSLVEISANPPAPRNSLSLLASGPRLGLANPPKRSTLAEVFANPPAPTNSEANAFSRHADVNPSTGLLGLRNPFADKLGLLATATPPKPMPNDAITWINWTGFNGKVYRTELYPIGTSFRNIPGVYIFCKRHLVDRWLSIYVGETGDFQQRLYENLASHHRWDLIRRDDATHVCVLQVPGGRTSRLQIETDLRHGLNPPRNQQ